MEDIIDKMNADRELYEQVKLLFNPYMHEELAGMKANEVMRITGHSFGY